MKRRIFFWLEKLKISRAERYAVSALVVLLMALLTINAIVKPSSSFDQDYYKEISQEFRRRSALLQQNKQRVLARYQIGGTSAIAKSDTIPSEQPEKNRMAATIQAIDINKANFKTLQQLPGIGPSYSMRIIEHRRKNGGFVSKNDLLKIKGIGKARLAKIKPLIKIGEAGMDVSSIALDSLPLPDKIEKRRPKEKEKVESASVINVNTADAQALQKLPGIGPAYAERIIKYRQQNGDFTIKGELLKIKGIGKKRLAKIKPFIKLTGQ